MINYTKKRKKRTDIEITDPMFSDKRVNEADGSSSKEIKASC